MRRMILLLSVLVSFTGCQQSDVRFEAEDDRNPWFQKAQVANNEHDFAAAAKFYESALQASPKVAQAHFELGQLYGEKLGDPVKAAYHYRRFLEERPTSERHDMVQALLDAAKFQVAVSIPNSPIQNSEAFAKLQADLLASRKEKDELEKKAEILSKEIALVKDEVSKAQAAAASAQAAATPVAVAPTVSTPEVSTSSVPAAASAPSAPAVAATQPATTAPAATTVAPEVKPEQQAPAVEANAQRTHVIQSGDTLWKISKKYYGKDVVSGIDKIKAANTDVLPEGKPLKIGTTIVIP